MQASKTGHSASLPDGTPRSLPARAQTLLNELQRVVEKTLEFPLQQCLLTLGEQLGTQAETTQATNRQNSFLSLSVSASKQAPTFASAFLRASQSALSTLTDPDPSAQTVQRPDQLSLVDDIEIDSDIALRDIARRESSRLHDGLQCLSQRMAVVTESPTWSVEKLPLGPHWICRRLVQATAGLALEPIVILRLYQTISVGTSGPLSELVHQANALLEAEGILPGLEGLPFNARLPGQRRRYPQMPTGTATEAVQPAFSTPGSNPTVAASTSGPQSLGNAPWLQALQNAFSGEGGTVHNAEHALAVLQQMLLSSAMAATASTSPAPASAPGTLSASQVGQLLSRLQSLTANNAHSSHRSIEDIRNALLAQARADHGPQAHLSPTEDNTLSLVAMLYRHLKGFMHPHSPAADLMAQLQLPLVRTAMQDEKFFIRGEHPVRELLNTIADAGARWQAADDIDPQWVQKIGQVVQQVADEFEDNEEVFIEANKALATQHQSIVRRAELAERRFIEAARGKERMSVARKQAEAAIEQACATQPGPPPLVARVLRQAWTDVLMLTLLRHGSDSTQWDQHLVTTAQIVATTSKDPAYMRDKALGSQVETALTQVGCLGDEAAAFARCLSTPGGGNPSLVQADLETRLDARTRLGAAEKTFHGNDTALELDADQDSALQHLLALPHGSMFEFSGTPPVEWRRLRLSWFSQVAGTALFVNNRGQKVVETTLVQLARDLAAGRIQLLDSGEPRIIDLAWQATLDEIRTQAALATNKDAL